MKVQELMVRDVQVCSPMDSLDIPARIMWEHDCGCVPVVDAKRRVIGMITDRDICMAAYTQGRRLGEMRVENVMSRNVHSCKTTDVLERVEQIMMREQVRRLPVLEADGTLAGILSINDLACEAAVEKTRRHKEVSPDQVGMALASICARRIPVQAGKPGTLTPAKPQAAGTGRAHSPA